MDSIITKQAAKVVSVNGNAHVKINGKEVPVTELAELQSGTELLLPPGAGALLQLEDGSFIPVGDVESENASTDAFAVDDEIAALQELLLNEDFDPTQELEATAAGNSPTGSGSQAPQVETRVGNETVAQAGFDTQGVSRSFNNAAVLREETDSSAAIQSSDETESTAIFTLSSTTEGNDIVEGGKITYTVTLGAAASEDITITLSNGQTITIEAGELSGSVDADVRPDDLYSQNDDDITVSIDSVSENDFDQVELVGTVTNKVVDDNDAPTLTLAGDTSVAEGESANYTLTLSDAPTEAMTVTVVIGHKTTEDGDIVPVERTFTFEPGQTEVSFDVETLDDAFTETEDEVFTVTVTGADGGGFENTPELPPVVETSITDDRSTENPDVDEDVRPDILITGGDTVREQDSDASDASTYLTYTVSLSGPAADDITATLGLGGTAGDGDRGGIQYFDSVTNAWKDYNGSITLPADGSDIALRVLVKDDAEKENSETVTITATTTSDLVTGKTGSASGTITDDRSTGNPDVDEDVRPDILITGGDTVREQDSDASDSSTYLTYTVSLSGPAADDITASLGLGGTAGDGDRGGIQYFDSVANAWKDYNGSITLPADGSNIALRVLVKDDAEKENSETVTITASTDSDLLTGKADSASGTITDDQIGGPPGVDEEAPNLLVENGNTVTEADGTFLTYQVKLSGPAAEDVLTSLALGSNTANEATADSDYINTIWVQTGDVNAPGNGWVQYTGSLTLPKDGSAIN
uniref:immunoglobulin-like domain-containing protein n=1 Tax=Enterovibrio calviensis TaxID=91359 RepID=UPI0004803188